MAQVNKFNSGMGLKIFFLMAANGKTQVRTQFSPTKKGIDYLVQKLFLSFKVGFANVYLFRTHTQRPSCIMWANPGLVVKIFANVTEIPSVPLAIKFYVCHQHTLPVSIFMLGINCLLKAILVQERTSIFNVILYIKLLVLKTESIVDYAKIYRIKNCNDFWKQSLKLMPATYGNT